MKAIKSVFMMSTGPPAQDQQNFVRTSKFFSFYFMKQQLVNMKCGMEKKWELLEEMRQRLETVVQGTTTVDKVLKLLLELETDLVKEK
jgi:hypothetical protein